MLEEVKTDFVVLIRTRYAITSLSDVKTKTKDWINATASQEQQYNQLSQESNNLAGLNWQGKGETPRVTGEFGLFVVSHTSHLHFFNPITTFPSL